MGGGKYFDTGHTTEEWDGMVQAIQQKDEEIYKLKQEIAAIKTADKREAIAVIGDVSFKASDTARIIAHHIGNDKSVVLVMAKDELDKQQTIDEFVNRQALKQFEIKPIPMLDEPLLISYDSSKGQKSARNLRRAAERKNKREGSR